MLTHSNLGPEVNNNEVKFQMYSHCTVSNSSFRDTDFFLSNSKSQVDYLNIHSLYVLYLKIFSFFFITAGVAGM